MHRLYYVSLGLHSKSCEVHFNSYKSLFKVQMTGLHAIVHQILVVEEFFEVLVYAVEISVKDFGNVVLLATDAAG